MACVTQAYNKENGKAGLKITEMRRKEMEGELKPEPLLTENPGRFVLFPIQDNEVSLLLMEKSFTTNSCALVEYIVA